MYKKLIIPTLMLLLVLGMVSANNFNATWYVPSANYTVYIPIVADGTYNFTVDWGDNTSNTTVTYYNTTLASHKYENIGYYNMSINGTITGFRFNNAGSRRQLYEISSFGPLVLLDGGDYFEDCRLLYISATDAPDLSNVTSFSNAFYNNDRLGDSNLSHWNTSTITNMNYMFSAAGSIQNLDISGWDVSSVTDFTSAFQGSHFNGNITGWNTSNALTMAAMFSSTPYFNQPIGSWDTSKVTNMRYIFANTPIGGFQQDLNGWDTSSVTDMAGAFSSSYYEGNLSDWDVSSVESFQAMFNYFYGHNVNVTKWNTSSATNMDDMFYYARYWGLGNDLNDWDVSKVTTMNQMFRNAVLFNNDLDQWDTSNVTDMGLMFNNAFDFNGNISTWNVSKVDDMNQMFYSAQDFNSDISGWDVSNVEDMSSMFRTAYSFHQPIGSWDTSSVTTMASMFGTNGASITFNENISGWNVSNVISFTSMFDRASQFNQNLNGWDVSKATSFASMFYNTLSFNQPLDQWDTSSATSYNRMFYGVANFDQDISNFDINGVTNVAQMFFAAGLSTTNYDLLLDSWATQGPASSLVFDAGSATYTDVLSKGVLEDTYSWTITDGGLDTSNAFLSTWRTTTANESITLPLRELGTYGFYVDWGDGSDDIITAWNDTNITHTYLTADYYNVTIVGTIDGFRFNNGGSDTKIYDISQWGSLTLGNEGHYFEGCINLYISATDAPNLTGTTNFGYIFENADGLGDSNLSHWNTSGVTNMQEAFRSAGVPNLDISGWDTSSVTDMDRMFFGSQFNNDISQWDVGKVTNMRQLFQSSQFNQNISNWNTSSVLSMESMFGSSSQFNQPIGSWDVSSVTNMNQMFWTNYVFNQPLDNWNTSSVTGMNYMFLGATAFNQDLNGWDVSSVTNMGGMFQGATNFNGNISEWNTGKVTTMEDMFNGATPFNQDVSGWNTSSVTNMNEMFRNTVFDQDISGWDVTSVTDMTSFLFQGVYSTENYNKLLASWSTQAVKNNVPFSVGLTKYSTSYADERAILTDTYSWTITDGGEISDCADGIETTICYCDENLDEFESGFYTSAYCYVPTELNLTGGTYNLDNESLRWQFNLEGVINGNYSTINFTNGGQMFYDHAAHNSNYFRIRLNNLTINQNDNETIAIYNSGTTKTAYMYLDNIEINGNNSPYAIYALIRNGYPYPGGIFIGNNLTIQGFNNGIRKSSYYVRSNEFQLFNSFINVTGGSDGAIRTGGLSSYNPFVYLENNTIYGLLNIEVQTLDLEQVKVINNTFDKAFYRYRTTGLIQSNFNELIMDDYYLSGCIGLTNEPGNDLLNISRWVTNALYNAYFTLLNYSSDCENTNRFSIDYSLSYPSTYLYNMSDYQFGDDWIYLPDSSINKYDVRFVDVGECTLFRPLKDGVECVGCYDITSNQVDYTYEYSTPDEGNYSYFCLDYCTSDLIYTPCKVTTNLTLNPNNYTITNYINISGATLDANGSTFTGDNVTDALINFPDGYSGSVLKNVIVDESSTNVKVSGDNVVIENSEFGDGASDYPIVVESTAENVSIRNNVIDEGASYGVTVSGIDGLELYNNTFTGIIPCLALLDGPTNITKYYNNTKGASYCKIRFNSVGSQLNFITEEVDIDFVGGNTFTTAAYIPENNIQTDYRWAYVPTAGLFDTNAEITYKNLLATGTNYDVYKNTILQEATLDYTIVNSTGDSLTIGVIGWSNWSIDILPDISQAFITPLVPVIGDDLHCNFEINKTDPRDVDINITWFQSDDGGNWTNVDVYNYKYANVTNTLLYTTTSGTGSYTGALEGGRQYLCQLTTDNGESVRSTNSTIKTFNPISTPELISPPDSYFTNDPQMVSIFNVVDDDGGIQCRLNTEYSDLLEDLLGGWNLNNGTDDVVGNNNGVGTDLTSQTNEYGRVGYATGFNGVSSNMIVTHDDSYDLGVDDKTLIFKMRSDTAWTSTHARVVDTRDSNNGYSVGLGPNNKLVVEIEENNNGVQTFEGTSTLNDLTWHTVIVEFDRNQNMSIYVDNILDGTFDITGLNTNITSTSDLYVGTDSQTGQIYDFNGYLDDVILVDRLLTTSEKTWFNALTGSVINGPYQLYNTSVDSGVNTTLTINFGEDKTHYWNVSCTATGDVVPVYSDTWSFVIDYTPGTISDMVDNQTLVTPEIGDNISISATVTDGNQVENCSLVINDNGTWRDVSNVTIGAPTGNLQDVYEIRNVSKGRFNNSIVYWNYRCYDGATNEFYGTQQEIIVKDVTNPMIILNPNNAFQSENDSIVSGNTTKNLNITFADWNLFQSSVNITCFTSGNLYYWENLNITDIEYTHLGNFSIEGLPLQACLVQVLATDDHTAEEIPKYKTKELSDRITYNTEHDINIQVIANDDDVRSVNSKKLDDRHTFTYKYSDVAYERSYTIDSDTFLYYRSQSQYPGHFVAWDEEKHTGNWIDMNYINKGARDISYEVNKINDYKYDVTIKSLVPQEAWTTMTVREIQDTYGLKELEFQSIGGVNTENITYEFYIGGAVNMTGLNVFDNSAISDWSVLVTSIDARPPFNGFFTISGDWETLEDVANGTYQLDFSHPQFFPQTEFVTVGNATQNLEWESQQSIVNVQAANIVTGELQTYMNVTVSRPSVAYSESRVGDNVTTTETFLLDAGTYNLDLSIPNYLPYSGTFTVGYQENITIPEQLSFLANVRLFDERYDIPFNVSSPDRLRFLLYCPDETKETVINSTNTSLLIDCEYEKFQFVLDYGATSYYRNIILEPDDAFNFDVYLIDLETTTSIYSTFSTDDLLAQYENPKVFLKKVIGNKTVIITSDAVDIETKIGAYLMENSEYILEIHSDNLPVRVMGNYFADEGGDKSLTLYDINLESNPTTFLSTVSYTVGKFNVSNSSILAATYEDINNETTRVTWNVYRDTYPGTLVYTSTIVGANDIEFLLDLTAANLTNTTLYSEMIMVHQQGTFTYTKLIQEFNEIVLEIMQFVSQQFMNWFLTIFLSVVAIFATVKTSNMVSVAMLLIAALFVMFGWFTLGWGIIALGILISFLSLIKMGDKET